MAAALEIRPLRTDDDRSTFSCGQPDLDRFFQHYAGQNQFRLPVAFYERYGFVPLEGVREGALHGDPTPLFLAIGTLGGTDELSCQPSGKQ